MSASGQGDQFGVNIKAENEISSTTPDNGGIKATESGPFTSGPEAGPADADSRSTNVASTSNNKADKDIYIGVPKLETCCGIKTKEEPDEEFVSDNSSEVEMFLDMDLKATFSKDVAELILAENDNNLDSAHGEELVLRWDDDDDEDEDSNKTPLKESSEMGDQKLCDKAKKHDQDVNNETHKPVEPIAEITQLENVVLNETRLSKSFEAGESTKDVITDTKNTQQDVEMPSNDKSVRRTSDHKDTVESNNDRDKIIQNKSSDTENDDEMKSHSHETGKIASTLNAPDKHNIKNSKTNDSDFEMSDNTSFQENQSNIHEIDKKNYKPVWSDQDDGLTEEKDIDIDMEKEPLPENLPKDIEEMDIDNLMSEEISKESTTSKDSTVVPCNSSPVNVEELVLRWEDDDVDEEEHNKTPQIESLKIPDQKIGYTPDKVNDETNKTNQNVINETDKHDESLAEIPQLENVVLNKMLDNTSVQENLNIIHETDNLTKNPDNIDKAVDLHAAENVINLKKTSRDDSFTEENQDLDTDMEKESLTAKAGNTTLLKNIETTTESSQKVIEEMDIHTLSEEITKDSEECTSDPVEITPNVNKKDEKLETFSKEPQKNVLENKDIVQKPIDELLESNNEKDTEIVQNTLSDDPSTIPIEVSNINKAKLNKDHKANKTLKALSTEKDAKKDTQKTDNNIDMNVSQDQNDASVSLEDSILDETITPNTHHRINKPNIMLDIPTQELSDIEAELDYDDDLYYKDKTHSIINDASLVESDNPIDIHINKSKDKTKETDKVVSTSLTKKITSPTIEIDATKAKLNISIVSPIKSATDVSKSEKSVIPSTSTTKSVDKSDIVDKKSKTDDIDGKKHQESDTIEKPISPKPSQDNDEQKPSSSKTMVDIQLLKLKLKQELDEKSHTSKLGGLPELTHNNEIQEVADSLGLLAESSRVVDDDNDDDDDDDDGEDPDADDADDDEDFDPYEESNSEMAEDMDDSNTPPPELDPKVLEGTEPKLIGERESDESTMDIADGAMDIVDDIECVENELQDMEMPDDAVSETPTEDNTKEDESEIIDADSHQEKSKTVCPPKKIINILEKVLGPNSLSSCLKEPISGVRTYVELEGSSDSDDVVIEESKSDQKKSDVVSVNIPKEIEVMSTSGPRGTTEMISKEGEVTISGIPKPPPHKMSKINTSEVTIKTTGLSSSAIHIPETTRINKPKDEIFNLDSDDEDTSKKETSAKIKKNVLKVNSSPKPLERKCVNPECTNETGTYYQADRPTAAYYSLTKRSAAVCEQCRQRASERSEALINGIKDLRPLLDLDMDAPSQQLVEISDSDSDNEAGDDTDLIGEKGAEFLEEHLADIINDTWSKYKLESRLRETETFLLDELEKLEAGAKEIDALLDNCQKKTDSIRFDFYKDYELRRKSVGAIVIHDTPFSSYSHTESDLEENAAETTGSRYPKRRAASIAYDTPAKRPAIPMGYKPLEGSHTEIDQIKTEDDKEDISVVKLSAESAPADLPPCGEIVRAPLKTGMVIYAMRNAFGTWLKGRIMDVQPKAAGQQFTQCRVKFEHKIKNPCKVLLARCLAYPEPSEVRMTIGTRVVALFKDPQNPARRDSFYSGVIAEIPNPVNNYRYLVFFDDGYAQYVHHQDTRIVCECSNLVWEEVHPFIRDFICNYLLSYPERPMVRLHAGEKLKTEWNGKWWDSKVLRVDASIALINFDEDNRTEWIYRGSTRLAPLYLELQAAEKAGEGRTRSRLPRSKAQMRSNMPCVEYTRSDEQASDKATAETQALQQHNEEMRRQRAVAKKSTTTAQTSANVGSQGTPFDGVISRVVYYTPKNAVKPYKMSAHTCTINCRRSDLIMLKDLRTYNPLAKPLLSGWERQTVRYKGHRDVVYRAPCGRRLRNMKELHQYLCILQSDLSVDLFDFTPGTHCLAEFVLHKCIVSKKDLSHGKENVPVPCVNYYDDALPEFCSYNTERTPTAGVPLNLDPEFLCGCDCTDDCMDKSKCACWKMTLEGARTIGLEGPNVGYVYRRLPEPLPSGIYECNSRCKCKQTCLNKVAQHPLQLKLQVFKTINRGWGIRALNDVPKGSFLCIYAGNLLTDATANLDGLNEGDEYLAELDYIEVVEGMKEGYEDDIPEADKKLDRKAGTSESESEPTSESEDEQDLTKKDGDFQPGYIPHSNMTFKKSLRKREKAKKKEEQEKQKEEVKKRDDCITISDDEEVREPSRFTAQAGMVDRGLVSKQSSRVSVRTLFGKDEACYIMDAKVQGNIGRYLNHSCHPNVFVQNVFVDTHDPRFPWVAFFALSNVRAGTELTWNYNYDIGSVPEKVLYCYCGAPNCRGRLL